MTYTLVVLKPGKLDPSFMSPQSRTTLEIPLDAAKKAAEAVYLGLPRGFAVELLDATGRSIDGWGFR